jgi:hypothetical protein
MSKSDEPSDHSRRAFLRRLLQPVRAAEAAVNPATSGAEGSTCPSCGRRSIPLRLAERLASQSGLPLEQVLTCSECKRSQILS